MSKTSSDRYFYFWLAGIVFAVYIPSLFNGFIWDDFLAVAQNSFVQSWANLKYLFSKEYFLLPMNVFSDQAWGSAEGVYRPVTTLTYFLDYGLWKLNPAGHHLSSILFHIITSCLVFRFLKFWVKNPSSAFVGALMFALHPVQVEAVGVISMRDDVLAGLFYMLAVNAYLEFRKREKFSFGLYAAMLASFALAVFSKEMAFTLPVVLWVVEYFHSDGKLSLKDVFARRYWGIYLVGILCLWIWGVVMKKGYDVSLPANLLTNIFTTIKVMGTYVEWIVNPLTIHQTVYADDYFRIHAFANWELWQSIGKILAACLAFAVLCRWIPRMALAGLWMLIAMLPAMNIIPMENVLAARFLYIPFVGFAVATALVWDRLWEDCPRKIFLKTIFAVFMCFYGLVLYSHQLRLKDNLSLSYYWVEQYPFHAKTRASLAWVYFYDKHAPERALEQALIAQYLNTSDCIADHSLGQLFRDLGKMDHAIASMRQTLMCDPQSYLFRSTLCAYYGEAKRYPEAAQCFEGLVDLDPSSAQAYYDLQYTYLLMGKPEKSARVGFRALWQWWARHHPKSPK